MAARFRIIALDKSLDAGRTAWRLVFWYDVPAARQVFYTRSAGTVSQWIGAIPADNTALQDGSVYEEVVVYSPDGTQATGAIETGAAAMWTARNAAFQANNPWANYGSTWDTSGVWTVATVT